METRIMAFITGNSLSAKRSTCNMDEGRESTGGVWPGKKLSEEERASWEQQRQRREKLSSLMGQYLLKGYRMLGSNCSDCGNILLQTRDGVNYCVQCSEIIQEGTSPQPSPPTAATFPTKSDSSSTVQNIPKPLAPADGNKTLSSPKDQGDDSQSQANTDLCVGLVEEALVAKLQWASRELAATTSSVEDSTQLCLLIKACAEALKSVRELDRKPHSSIMKTPCDTNCCL